VTAEESVAPAWDESAYILHGQHCPKMVIRETLKSAMQALGAGQMMHIAFSDQGIVGSLSFVIDYPQQLGQKLDELLERAASRSAAACLAAAVRGKDSEAVLDLDTARGIATNITKMTLSGYSLSSDEENLFIKGIRSGIYLTHTGSQHITPEVSDIRSVILLDKMPMATRLLHVADLPHRLAVQLKSTAESSALSDMAVMRRVAERLRSSGRGISDESFSAIASKALDLARDVTNSNAGAIYFTSTRAKHPFERCVSSESESFPDQIPHDATGDLVTVVSQNLAIQRIDWFARTNDGHAAAPPSGNFLLAPIGGPGIDPGKPAIGLLVLRRDNPMQAFSAYDLALIRNVTLRISLARTTDVAARIGEVTSELRMPTDWLSIQEDLKNAPPDSPDAKAVPTDARIAARRIAPFLEELAGLTESHSVSLRLALPSTAATQSHGLALVTVACHPGTPWTSRLPVQTENIGGFNWDCIYKNGVVHSPDVTRQASHARIWHDTMSELAVPVREEGMLVGVLNLQSSLFDAYTPILPLVTAFAGAVGRTLADARAALEDHVIDSAAQALNHRHTMESRLDRLTDRIETVDLDEGSRILLRLDLEGIKSELDAMRRIASPEVAEAKAIPQILQSAAAEVGYLGGLPDDMWIDQFAKPVPGARARSVQVAVANILSNLINYTATSVADMARNPVRTISLAVAYLEASKQIVLGFQNYADEYVSSARIADLYRCPIPDAAGRLRVGGFLAGLSARRANARLQAVLLDDGRTVRTTLIVPIEG
jgi:hypothetical protein